MLSLLAAVRCSASEMWGRPISSVAIRLTPLVFMCATAGPVARARGHQRAELDSKLEHTAFSPTSPTSISFCCQTRPLPPRLPLYTSCEGRPFLTMQQSRSRAVTALKGTRAFSTSAHRAAVSPFRRPANSTTQKVVKDDAKRPQSTAAAATQTPPARARPSPAFNREDYSNVQPLKPYRQPAMDHSFVGMTGGEIFHEMMLRQGVKHICTFPAIAAMAAQLFFL